MRVGAKIIVKGVVQGVGFRPFIHRLAVAHNLAGWVLNSRGGVVIEVEGKRETIEHFYSQISHRPPPLAIVETAGIDFHSPGNLDRFQVRRSRNGKGEFVLISPDISICGECLQELGAPRDRRYKYPFINCTNCGPRFSLIKDLPYDRVRTTMKRFPMCPRCAREYGDISSRRYHAEPNACPDCGPEVQLIKNEKLKNFATITLSPTPSPRGRGNREGGRKAIDKSIELLKSGRIIAVKGVGGYHLACDARNGPAVRELRRRKCREDKPFALMAPTVEVIKELCEVGRQEEKLLLSARRPLVLLKKKEDSPIAEAVAPGQKYLGVMLPYTPLHYLFFEGGKLQVLVMTSGNISDELIAYQDEEAWSRLGNIADYFLRHNRDIHIRCDDSVSRVWEGEEMLLRRSRGYVPHPLRISLPFQRQVLACGAELKNTFCLTRDDYAFLSHHIGDLKNLETLTSFREGIEHFKGLFRIQPEIIACDNHPQYLSTQYAQEFRELSRGNLKLIQVQHHHAHVAGCMAENGLEEKVIGVAFDGSGHGVDGASWGGEFLLADFKGFQRRAHFQYIPLPGGEMAIKEPWRLVVSYLYQIYGDDFLKMECIKRLDEDKCRILLKMLKQSLNCPLTSSVGRLFDTVSSLLGIRDRVNYEGQAAVELEMLAEEGEGEPNEIYGYEVREEEGVFIVNPHLIIREIIDDLEGGIAASFISAKFHRTLAWIIGEVCNLIRRESGLDKVVLSGGVFQNMFLLKRALPLLREGGFQVYTHHKVPPNDGGISLGQAVIADRSAGE
ncbi:carbamoyltransferase HypF [candidate division NPL-UPA2 bacterium]|nr:carbamoyltransferase HypF [candidate division NPL-UPA2 bacterium]